MKTSKNTYYYPVKGAKCRYWEEFLQRIDEIHSIVAEEAALGAPL